jgi:putative transposase
VTTAVLKRTTVAPADTITQAYRYALSPTPAQANLLRSHIGGARFAYNALLGLIQGNWEENRAKKLAGAEVTRKDYLGTGHFDLLYLWAKKRDKLAPWWGENGSSTYNTAAQRLSRSFTNWKKGRAQFPTRKKLGNRGSVTFLSGAVKLTDSHHVRVSRVGEVKSYESTRKMYRRLERGTGRILSATVSQVGDNFFISFALEVTRSLPVTRAPEKIIGIDLGISALYTGATLEGERVLDVANPRHFVKTEKKLVHAQRIASRRQGPRQGQSPSKHWRKANTRIQRIHAGVANSRRNLIHETTTRLAKDYDFIVVENLSIKIMLGNHALAKHISDAGWGEFRRQLVYKTSWYGSTLVVVDRFYPSSKTCSSCGAVKAKLTLDERKFHCEECGIHIDRDLNAAINLARRGLAGTSSVTGRGGEARPDHQILDATAHPDEASTEPPQAVDGVGETAA